MNEKRKRIIGYVVVSWFSDEELSDTWLAEIHKTREEAEEHRRDHIARYPDDGYRYTVEPVGAAPAVPAGSPGYPNMREVFTTVTAFTLGTAAFLAVLFFLTSCTQVTAVTLVCDVEIRPDTIIFTAHPDSVQYCEALR